MQEAASYIGCNTRTHEPKVHAMGLFKPDLYRSFGLGFLIGTMIVGASLTGGDFSAIPQAIAATVG